MSANTLDTSTFYDRVYRTWGDLENANPAVFHRRRVLLRLIGQHARSASRALEVGCGLGALLKRLPLVLPNALVHGADVSEASLAASRRACPLADVFQLDLDAADFDVAQAARTARFDLVVCSEVLEHLADDARALERIRTLLAPDGVLVLSVPGGTRTRFDSAIGHLRHYTSDGVAALLREQGYQVERLISWGFPFHTLYRSVVRIAARLSLGTGGDLNVPRAPLALGYRALGAVLKPLYYLNSDHWGEQLFAVARRNPERATSVANAGDAPGCQVKTTRSFSSNATNSPQLDSSPETERS